MEEPIERHNKDADTLGIARRIAEFALEKQAEDLVILDLRGKVPYCDYFVICNGRSRRQVRAVALAVEEGMKAESSKAPIAVEGAESSRWVLVDYGDVVLHVFEAPLRDFYDLDTLWSDAPRIYVDPPRPAMEISPIG